MTTNTSNLIISQEALSASFATSINTSNALSKKEFSKLLSQMMSNLAEVLNAISGNSIAEINTAVDRSKLYIDLIELVQQDLEAKLAEVQKLTQAQTAITAAQKTLSWVMFGCALFLMLLGGIAAATGVGVVAGVAAISMGASMLVSSTLEVTGAIDAMDAAIDKEYTVNGVVDEHKASQAKLAAKGAILLLLTIFTMGAGAVGNGAATAVKTATTAGLQASKAARFGAQFAMGTTKAAKAAFILGNTAFIGLNFAPVLDMTTDFIMLDEKNSLAKKEDASTINMILMVISMALGLRGIIVKGAKATVKEAKNLGRRFSKKTATPAPTAAPAPIPVLTPAQTQALTKLQAIVRGGQVRTNATRTKAATKIQSVVRGRQVRANLAAANTATTNSNSLTKLLKTSFDFVKKKTPNKEDFGELLLMLLKLGTLSIITYSGVKSGELNIKKGNLSLQIGDLLATIGALNASESLTNNWLDVNKDFISTINTFIEKVQNLLRVSAENPKEFIHNDIEFARTFGQAV